MAQIVTPKMAKLGPDNNFTAYIYIYMATAPSVAQILAKNLFFPQFYSKNGPKKGGVDPLPFLRILPRVLLFWGGEKAIVAKKSLEKCEFFECSVFSGT